MYISTVYEKESYVSYLLTQQRLPRPASLDCNDVGSPLLWFQLSLSSILSIFSFGLFCRSSTLIYSPLYLSLVLQGLVGPNNFFCLTCPLHSLHLL